MTSPASTSSSAASFVTIFDNVYDQPDCRGYARKLHDLGCAHHGNAAPVYRAVVDALINCRGLTEPKLFDFASSYGFVSALLKYDLSWEACLSRYMDPALDKLSSHEMAELDRVWLADLRLRLPKARFVGLDICANAVRYASQIGLLDDGFAEDIEENAPSDALAACLAETDIVVEFGSVAHLMPNALDRILTSARGRKPWVITSPVRGNERKAAFEVLSDHGMVTETLGLPPFVHRRFECAGEQSRAAASAREAGHDTTGLEDSGHFFAQVYLSRPAEDASPLDLTGCI